MYANKYIANAYLDNHQGSEKISLQKVIIADDKPICDISNCMILAITNLSGLPVVGSPAGSSIWLECTVWSP